jgi:hypothetical protein
LLHIRAVPVIGAWAIALARRAAPAVRHAALTEYDRNVSCALVLDGMPMFLRPAGDTARARAPLLSLRCHAAYSLDGCKRASA